VTIVEGKGSRISAGDGGRGFAGLLRVGAGARANCLAMGPTYKSGSTRRGCDGGYGKRGYFILETTQRGVIETERTQEKTQKTQRNRGQRTKIDLGGSQERSVEETDPAGKKKKKKPNQKDGAHRHNSATHKPSLNDALVRVRYFVRARITKH